MIADRARPRRSLAVLVVVATLLVTAGGLSFHLVRTPPAPLPALSAGAGRHSLVLDGYERTYTAYVPAGLEPGAPLLVVFHGTLENGDTIREETAYGFDALADRGRFAVAYPDGYERGWNDCRRVAATAARRKNVDDKKFVQALAAEMRQRYGVSDRRIFAAGYSNGGQMVYRLAAELPGRIAAMATIGAGLPAGQDNACPPIERPVATLVMAGTDDPISPYGGGEVTIFGFSPRGRVLSADDTTRTFVRVNGLPDTPASRDLPHRGDSGDTRVTVKDYREAGKPPVSEYTVHGGGHVVPTSNHRFRRLLGRSTHDVDAPTVISDFFGLTR